MRVEAPANNIRSTGMLLSMDRRWTCLFFVVAMLTSGATALAHHGSAAWDMKSTITVQGTVTEFRFLNPHVQIFFDSIDEKGNTVHWGCEAADPAMLVRQGWTRETMKPGDHVTLTGHPSKGGAKLMDLQKLSLANGQELDAKGAAQ